MTHTRRQRARGAAVPRKAPDMAASPWPGRGGGPGGLPHDENPGLGALETPEGFDAAAAAAEEGPAPLSVEGFDPKQILLAGAALGWIWAGRRGRGKGQGIRLLDVFLIGPLFAQAGLWESRDAPWAQALMRVAAGATVTYNLRNYLDAPE